MAEKKENEVEEKLRALFDLQLIKSEIDKIKTLRGELPLEVRDLEDEIEGLHTRVSVIEKEIADAEASIRDKKMSIDDSRNAIAKHTEEQNNVRNNREYENLDKEIKYQELAITLCQKKIDEDMRFIEDRRADLERTQAIIETRSTDLAHKKEELDSIIADTKQQEDELRQKAEAQQKKIDARYLDAFDRIRSNARNGLAVVRIIRCACGGCFNQIPLQRKIDIEQRKDIIQCEYCGRLMVDLALGNEEVKKTGYGEVIEETAPEVEAKPKRKSRISSAS